LTPPQQVTFVRAQPAAFKPASGAWGKRGCTIITLREAKKSIVKEALSLAWHNTGPERLLQQDDET
jgi:hypothetical protein